MSASGVDVPENRHPDVFDRHEHDERKQHESTPKPRNYLHTLLYCSHDLGVVPFPPTLGRKFVLLIADFLGYVGRFGVD